MNKDNLRRMAEHIGTVSQECFDMEHFRTLFDYENQKCNSVGCVIGHCTILDSNPMPHFRNSKKIWFRKWSEDFTGLKEESTHWQWCFGWRWIMSDNTPIGASKRILWLIENGLPGNWINQMRGFDPLCYMQNESTNEPN